MANRVNYRGWGGRHDVISPSAERGEDRNARSGVPASVAIVDDDPQLVKTYELLFQRRKVPIAFVAYDGFAALEQFQKADPRPTVAIIDYRMPAMSGIDLTREMLKIEPRTRIVLISADDGIRQEAIDAGANAFLKKPVGLKEIMQSIRPV